MIIFDDYIGFSFTFNTHLYVRYMCIWYIQSYIVWQGIKLFDTPINCHTHVVIKYRYQRDHVRVPLKPHIYQNRGWIGVGNPQAVTLTNIWAHIPSNNPTFRQCTTFGCDG